ncbi:uncharacterized protein LOC134281787 isoform X5 [Saccostrea cucullata]|uniref:uncharacterized protein LOC134281787 isoform X5 n=1 Tax=Saccostrea cuccullata TaxID=36930 RepID=UPI002ED2AEAF
MTAVTIAALIFATDFVFCYENIALFKPTWQSNQYNLGNDIFHSSNAVDGLKTDLGAWGGQCVISADKQRTAIWWLNLTSVVSIHHILIYYRTENEKWGASNPYTSRFLGFSVYISNTTDRLDGHLCFHDTIYNRSTIPAVVNITCPVHGQYVIYYNERLQNVNYPTGYSQYAFTDFCEVEVYGCVNPMRYGSNCSLLCPVNCRQYCQIQSGNCFQCSPGYKGEHCEQKCDGNQYGPNCGKTCGSCRYLRQCHHVNGSCEDGCNPGYQGEKCNKVCSFGYFGSDCKEECSAFCKTTRDCHYETGSCTEGCKSGWQGHDCFQIQEKEENDWPSRFYGLLAAFCVCVAVIVVLLVVVFLQRRRIIVRKAQKTLKESKNPQCNTGYVDVMSTENIKSEYQELSDIKEPSTYDVIK